MRDPLGRSLLYYLDNPDTSETLKIHSDHFDDFDIPLPYFFRTQKDMPRIEKKALKMCKGAVLDVGAGAGCHSLALIKRGLNVTAIDSSAGAIEAMQRQNINAVHADFWKYKPEQPFNTILMLMNGLGLMGNMSEAPTFFKRIKQLLAPGGNLLVDSSDIKHLYQEDYETIIELSGKYLGESRFSFEFQDEKSPWFDWVYLEYELLEELALLNGFSCEKIDELPDGTYLAKLSNSSAK
jgi:SAM-dependent methyltransferase